MLIYRRLECCTNILQSSIYMPACYFIQKKHVNLVGQVSGYFFMGGKLGLLAAVWLCPTQLEQGVHTVSLLLGTFLRLFHGTFLSYSTTHPCCVFPTHTGILRACVYGCLCMCTHFISVYNERMINLRPKEHLHKNMFLNFSGETNNLMTRFPNF